MKASTAYAAFIFLLLLGLPFAAWSQELSVGAFDKNGLPLEKARVEISYQSANALSETDGLLIGETGEDGYFRANLSNRVPKESEVRKINVRLSSYYAKDELRTLEANESGEAEVLFTLPFQLKPVELLVYTRDGARARNASIFISGPNIRKSTGLDGSAKFFLPTGFNFSGFAQYEGETLKISSAQLFAGEGNAATITFPPHGQSPEENSAGIGNSTFKLLLIDKDGKPAAGEKLSFLYFGDEYSAYTSPEGFAEFRHNKSGLVQVYFTRYQYDYRFTYNITGNISSNDSETFNKTIAISPLIKLGPLLYKQNATNCYLLSTNASADPRPGFATVVVLYLDGPYLNRSLPVRQISQSEKGGLSFGSELCVDADTQVRAIASDPYDTAQAFTVLGYSKPPPPPKKTGRDPVTGEVIDYEPTPPPQESTLVKDVLLSLAALAIVGGIGAAFVFQKAHVARGSRFILSYLRHILQLLQKKKRRQQAARMAPPPGSSFQPKEPPKVPPSPPPIAPPAQ